MSDEIREQLSALADDELSAVEQPLLLGRLQRDPQLRACLGRYQLIGDVMRGTGVTATLSIADRVQQSLALEAETGVMTRQRRWLKPITGVAVAASVALVAVLTVTSVNDSTSDAVPVLATSADAVAPVVAPAPVIARFGEPAGEAQWDRLDPSIDKRLSGYLVNHNQYATSRGVQSVMPYVRIVGHDTSE